MFLWSIEHFLSDIRGPRYTSKNVYFLGGHQVSYKQVWGEGVTRVAYSASGKCLCKRYEFLSVGKWLLSLSNIV